MPLLDPNNPLTFTAANTAKEAAAADAMYAALQAGDQQAYQAASRQYYAITGNVAPGALQGNPWNAPAPGQVTPTNPVATTAAGTLPAALQPQRLEAATGPGALVQAHKWQSMFVSGGGGGGIIGGGLALGGPVGLVVGAVFSFLGGLFGGIFGGGDANKAIGQLRDEFTNVSNALIQGYAALARTVGSILKWIATLAVSFVKTLFGALGKLLGMLKDLYEKILKPALQAIQKIRQRILDIYTKYMRPALVIMQRIHQVLTVLKLFHLKFAAKLDAQLMALEAKLTQPMYILLGHLNQIANMLNLVFDAGLTLKRALVLNALDSTKGAWSQMWWNAQTAPAFGSPAQPPPPPTPAQAAATAEANFTTYATTGAGPMKPLVDSAAQAFTAAVQHP